jgi:hypothetical protein
MDPQQDLLDPVAFTPGAPPPVRPPFVTQYPLMFWNPMSNGAFLPCCTVKWSSLTLLPVFAMNAGRPSSDLNRTELLVNVMPLMLCRYQPYAGRVPMLFGL